MNECNVCHKVKKDCSLEPNRSAMLFGMDYGHSGMEYRCLKCEQEVIKKLDEVLRHISKTS